MKMTNHLSRRGKIPHEEQPDTPPRRPEAASRTFADWTGVEAVVDQVFEVLRHAHLPHELVLVPVHTGQSTDMREDILQRVGELEGVDVAQTVLHVSVDDELGETKNFTT